MLLKFHMEFFVCAFFPCLAQLSKFFFFFFNYKFKTKAKPCSCQFDLTHPAVAIAKKKIKHKLKKKKKLISDKNRLFNLINWCHFGRGTCVKRWSCIVSFSLRKIKKKTTKNQNIIEYYRILSQNINIKNEQTTTAIWIKHVSFVITFLMAIIFQILQLWTDSLALWLCCAQFCVRCKLNVCPFILCILSFLFLFFFIRFAMIT